MSDQSKVVECERHGEGFATFTCQHLPSGIACGYFAAGDAGSEDPGGTLSVSVRDDGIGMTDEQLARCFEPFYQADASATREVGGAGLGLTTALRLCETLGGELTVQSEPGQGSTFELTLPAA